MKTKTIALVEVAIDGHRKAYMQLFIEALIQQEYHVLCIIPNSDLIADWVTSNCANKHLVTYAEYNFRWSKYPLPNMLSERLVYLRNIREINKIVTKYSRETNRSVDLIFLNYADRFLVSKIPHFIIDRILKTKWAGLLIHSGMYRTNPGLLESNTTINSLDFPFSSKKCVGFAVHDENIIPAIEKRLNTKTFLFPEIADLTDPNLNHPTYLEIKERSKGRIIIGSIGLEPHKCGYQFMKLASLADENNYFFVFTGVFHEHIQNAYSTDELNELNHFFEQKKENCYINFGHITEGEEYNSIFASFDIVYLMYTAFFNASNRLTKASYFKKHVLGPNYGIIGEDIENYSLGQTAHFDDYEEQLSKIEKMKKSIDLNDFPLKTWKIYTQKHKKEILPDKFNQLLELTD